MRAAASVTTPARPSNRNGMDITSDHGTCLPRSAPPSPKLSSAQNGDLDITRYLVSSMPKSSIAMRVSAWGSPSSSPSKSHMADHLPSSLPPSTVRKLNSPKQCDEKVEINALRPQTRTGPRPDGRKKQVGSRTQTQACLQKSRCSTLPSSSFCC
jgi:hypothetical protein